MLLINFQVMTQAYFKIVLALGYVVIIHIPQYAIGASIDV